MSPEPDDRPWQALLIYTAAGDAEGTMGGLVRMGKPGYLEPTVLAALREAQWCAADPVCMELAQAQVKGQTRAAWLLVITVLSYRKRLARNSTGF